MPTRVRVQAKTVLSGVPLKQEKAKVTLQLVVNMGNIQIMTVASLERQDFANAGELGERLGKMDARRTTHGHEEPVLTSNQTLSRAADELPEHEQSSLGFPREQ